MRIRVRSMRWRIALPYVLLLTVTLTLLALILGLVLRANYLSTLATGAAGQARLIALMTSDPALMTSTTARAALVQRLHDQLDARITLIAPDGMVVADSLPDEVGTDLRLRPEVRAALAGAQSQDVRYNSIFGDDAFFVAVPIGSPGAWVGVARIGTPLTTIAQTQGTLMAIVIAFALCAIALAVGLAIVIAQHIARPLLALRTLAGRLAEGDLDVHMPIPSDMEVGALAHDFNLMAQRLRQLVHALQTEREQLAAILSTMADGIIMIDADTVTLANPAATRMLQIVGPLPTPLAALIVGSALAPAVRSLYQGDRAQATTVVVEELVVPIQERSLRAAITRLAIPAAPQTLIVLQDLTELRHAEQGRRALVANISHDLQTPLASLQAMIETLHDGAIEDHAAARDFLWRMDEETQRMSRLVRAFLELSRIESPLFVLERSPTDLAVLLHTAVARMHAQAQQRSVDLTLAVAPDLPPLWLDAQRIEQVVLNLLQNALAFTPGGGSITVQAGIRENAVHIQVRDTGVGVGPGDLPHLFERFYKADRARSGGGTGLGLAIVKHLVEHHGGQVAAESQLGIGTTMVVSLPLTNSTLRDLATPSYPTPPSSTTAQGQWDGDGADDPPA